MPYIKEEDRNKFSEQLELLSKEIENYGDINYVITILLKNFIEKKGERYDTYNSIIGVLECAKLEMYRRNVVVYEDKKIKENGDV